MRQEAAELFRQTALIHETLGQVAKAADAYSRQAKLLTTLLKESPGDKDLRLKLADSYRSLVPRIEFDRRWSLWKTGSLWRGREAT